jgi:hypothetical protein
VDCSVRFEFGDADYLGHDGSWANGFLTVTTIDRTPWMFCCTAVGTGIFLCSFEGERLYFEDCRLEDCLEELLPILVREVEEYLGLSYTTH